MEQPNFDIISDHLNEASNGLRLCRNLAPVQGGQAIANALLQLNERLDQLGTRVDQLGTRLDHRLDEFGTQFDEFGARFDQFSREAAAR